MAPPPSIIVLAVVAALLGVAVIVLAVLYAHTKRDLDAANRPPGPGATSDGAATRIDASTANPAQSGSRLTGSLEKELSKNSIAISRMLSRGEDTDVAAGPTLAIVTPTYHRANKKTLGYLKRTIDCVLYQSYANWRWYIVGDCYDDPAHGHDAEVRALLEEVGDPRITWFNMAEPGERGKVDSSLLWCVGGATANNVGIERLLADGLEWYVHLDDDDVWAGDHLQTLVDGIAAVKEAQVVYTQAQYAVCPFPASPSLVPTTLQPPQGGNAIHSSLCFNVRELADVRYRPDQSAPADGRLLQDLQDAHAVAVLMPSVTVFHVEEGGKGMSKGLDLMHRLYIGKGCAAPAGWLTVDLAPEEKMDHGAERGALKATWDPFCLPYPLRDGSCVRILVDQCALDGREYLLAELWRLLAPGGRITVTTSGSHYNALHNKLATIGVEQLGHLQPDYCVGRVLVRRVGPAWSGVKQ